MLQIFYKWCANQAKPEASLLQAMQEEAELLHRDTVNRELKLIDDKYKIEANRAKAEYLLKQIQATQPS